ncbi:MAG: hypothetical protein Ct9H300mP3_01580 [Gammaproteobacteria bacterium]|nr:MAG: hypothetical protein Ct9H300mP3_01580 [Gammaproteobacteria bacterium]
MSSVGDDLIVALNLAPTTPEWLEKIGGNPEIRLGLERRGAFFNGSGYRDCPKQQTEWNTLDIRRKLRDEKIRYNSLFVEKDQTIKLKVTDEAYLNQQLNCGGQFSSICYRYTEEEINLIFL